MGLWLLAVSKSENHTTKSSQIKKQAWQPGKKRNGERKSVYTGFISPFPFLLPASRQTSSSNRHKKIYIGGWNVEEV